MSEHNKKIELQHHKKIYQEFSKLSHTQKTQQITNDGLSTLDYKILSTLTLQPQITKITVSI